MNFASLDTDPDFYIRKGIGRQICRWVSEVEPTTDRGFVPEIQCGNRTSEDADTGGKSLQGVISTILLRCESVH